MQDVTLEVTQDFKERLGDIVQRTIRTDADLTAVRRAIKRKAQADLWYFSYHVCDFPDVANELHVGMCARWQKRANRRFTLNLIPRSHLKTTLWTVAGTLHELVQDWVTLPGGRQLRGQNLRFLIVNAKLDNAIDIMRDIKSIITTGDMFKWLFPEYVPDEQWQRGRGRGVWTNERIDLPCSRQAGRKEGNIEVMSVGANLTSKHYDVMIFDDPVNEDNVTTKQYRDRIHRWYRNALQLRNDPISSRVRLIGTRWHYDDLYGRLIRQEEKRRSDQQDRGEDIKPVYYLYRRKAIEKGTPIWPERFTKDELDRLKTEELGSYVYSCQYDNEPLPEEDAHFKRDHIKFIDELDLPEGLVNFVTVDMADEETTRGDFTVITVTSFDEYGSMYVREIQRGKFSQFRLLEMIHATKKRWDARLVGIETTGFQRNIVRGYKHQAEVEGWFIPWKEINRGKSSKFQRGLGLQPRVERGDFYIVEGIKDAEWLIEEMITFPLGVNDDILDTVVDAENIYYAAPESEESIFRRPSGKVTFAEAYGDITEVEDEFDDDALSLAVLR